MCKGIKVIGIAGYQTDFDKIEIEEMENKKCENSSPGPDHIS